MAKVKRTSRLLKYAPLNLKERGELVKMLNSDVMQRALALAETMRPSLFGAGVNAAEAKDASMATLLANNRLRQMQGWEMFITALALQCEDPKVQREQIEETFPDIEQPQPE